MNTKLRTAWFIIYAIAAGVLIVDVFIWRIV